MTTTPLQTTTLRDGLGAIPLEDGRCLFRVWAPRVEKLEVHVVAPFDRFFAAEAVVDGPSGAAATSAAGAGGYHEVVVDDLPVGARYKLRLNGKEERPDPASRLQPEGVHGVSEIVEHDFDWKDGHWRGLPLQSYVIYELHVGSFTTEGTFDAVIGRLDELKELGVTAIELLPIAQFPGTRNWGYDGVQPYAAQSSYGGPLALKRLVDASHARNLAVVLDVVYNHLGPEGNYLREFGPYFTDRYKTPWGQAMNFDGPDSDHVRRYFVENALMWIDEFHVDALRVDAVHAIVDHSAQPFLQDLCSVVRERAERLGRKVFTIAESDLNAPQVLLPASVGGLGFDAQWSDDFHHSLHALLTGEKTGYYVDYGTVSDLAAVSTAAYLFTGQYSQFRQRRYGAPPNMREGEKFVVSAQNHDQVGNRMHGDRLSSLLSFEQLKVSAGALILFPFLPMLFMGEEYGETAPFQYFTSHSDEDLIESVRKGRHEEFEAFTWQGEAPDPHDEETFRRSKLNWNLWKSNDEERPVPTVSGAAVASAAGGRAAPVETRPVNDPRQPVIPNVSEGSGGWAGATHPTNDLGPNVQRSHHAQLRALHRELLRLRRELPALSTLDLLLVEPHADEEKKTLALLRTAADGSQQVWIAFNFSDQPRSVNPPDDSWKLLLDSNDTRWGGAAEKADGRPSNAPLAPTSFRLYVRQ